MSKIRLQDYAPKVFHKYIPSNSGIKKAIKCGRFLADGEIAKTGTWVQKGQHLELIESLESNQKVYEFPMNVLFEDEQMAAIMKPSGIKVSGNTFKTVANALLFNLTISNAPDFLAKPTPVHRLDSATSGILLIAKTKTAQIELGKQFENNLLQKQYCAIVQGEVHSKVNIDTPIDGKRAETSFEIIKVIKSVKYKELSCLKVAPKTGRTHQIRIHLASIGHPIIGDKLYGQQNQNRSNGKGLFLCASEITFLHPKTFKKTTIKIEVPSKFTSLLNREKRRYNTYNLGK